MKCFEMLGIEKTTDIKMIKSAYAVLLPQYSPEENPEGFQKLREAYEEAQRYAKDNKQETEDVSLIETTEIEDELSNSKNKLPLGESGRINTFLLEKESVSQKSLSPLEAFLADMDHVYNEYTLRLAVEQWEALLERPLCHYIDTASETEHKILEWLMDHYYLPFEVWQVFDKTFEWSEKRQTLIKDFPEGFIDYILEKVTEPQTFEYNELKVIANEAEAFLNTYHKAFRMFENNAYYDVVKTIAELEEKLAGQTNVQVLRARCEGALGRIEKALKDFDRFMDAGIVNLDVSFYRGELLFKLGRLEEAKLEFKKALEIKPESIGSMYYYGKCCLGLEKYMEAVESYKWLREKLPTNPEVIALFKTSHQFAIESLEGDSTQAAPEHHYSLAKMYFAINELDKSKKYISLLHAESILNSEQWRLLGHLASAAGDIEDALKSLESALELAPQEWENHMALASVYHEIDEYQKAVYHYEKSLQLGNQDIVAYNNLAHALLKSESYQQALDYCNQTIAMNNSFPHVYKNRGMVYFKLNRYEDCLTDYDHAIALMPQMVEAYVLKMETLNELEHYTEVHQVFTQARDLNLDHIELYLQKAHAYKNIKEYDQAVVGYDYVLEQDPQNHTAMTQKGLCLYYMSQYQEAIESFDLAIATGKEITRPCLMKGWSYFMQEHYQETCNWLKEALEKDVETKDRFYHLMGDAYTRLNHQTEAVEVYKKALEINAEPYEYHYGAGFGLSELEQFEAAIPYLKKAHELNPDHQDVLVTLSYVFYCTGKFKKAVGACNRLLQLDPNHENGFRNKAWALYRLGEKNAVLEVCNEALKNCGERENIMNLKIKTLVDLDKKPEALLVASRMLEVFPDSDVAKNHYQELQKTAHKKSWLKGIVG